MKTRQKRPRAAKPETLSMDWFVENFVDKSFQDDPQGCHSNLQEHEEAVNMCVETLKNFGIINPYQFLNRWMTSEILTGLDAMVGQELQGNVVDKPAGWLWSYLQVNTTEPEPAGYPERSSEVVNSVVRQLKRRGVCHPGYLVTTYPLELVLEAINSVDELVARGESVANIPELISSLVAGVTDHIERAKAMKKEDLTPAEMAMLRLIARGQTTEEICEELNISEHTLTGRLNSILSKLGARNRAHAVAIALRRGILSEEDINGESES